MAIKIDQSDTSGLYPAGGSRTNASQDIKDNGNSNKLVHLENKINQDSIRLTNDGQRAAATEQALPNTPVTDESRIESIRAAIQSRQYSIDAQQIADKILLLEKDL